MKKIVTAMLLIIFSVNSYAKTKGMDVSGGVSLNGIEFFKLSLSLLLVIVVIVVLSLILKKINRFQLSKNDSIQIKSLLNIGVREKLMIIEVSGEEVLVGVTNTSINHILTLKNRSGAKTQPEVNELNKLKHYENTTNE